MMVMMVIEGDVLVIAEADVANAFRPRSTSRLQPAKSYPSITFITITSSPPTKSQLPHACLACS
jgi:hypothetical protein